GGPGDAAGSGSQTDLVARSSRLGGRMGLVPLEDHVVDRVSEIARVGADRLLLDEQEAHSNLEPVAGVARREELDDVLGPHGVEIEGPARSRERVALAGRMDLVRSGE